MSTRPNSTIHLIIPINEILLLADGNTPKNHKEFVDLFAVYDMTDLLPDQAPPTCSRSKDTSRPFGTRLFEQAIHSLGFYPFYHFNGSDHRETEIVFNRKLLFAGSIPNTCWKRIINPKNVKHTKNFIKHLAKLHNKSKTMEALMKVEELFKSGTNKEDRKTAIIKAQNIATRSLLQYIDNANKKVVRPLPNHHIPWSPELKMARQHLC